MIGNRVMPLFAHPRLLRLASLCLRVQFAWQRRSGAVRKASHQRDAFYRHAWREAAAQLGAEIEDLSDDISRIMRDDFQTKVCRNYTALDDPVTLALAGNKPAVYRLLAHNGLPMPRHALFSLEQLDLARAFLRKAGMACVVKPASDTGAGRGVATSVTTERQLLLAAAAAAVYDRALLIEEQIAAANYRLLYLDGVLLDAVLRHPPTVTGDGRATIRELVGQTNSARLAGGFAVAQVLLTVDGEMRRTLARQRLSLRSIPPPGQKVIVKAVINENAALDNEAVNGTICPSVVAAGARAAQCIGARLAGVDILTTDPSRPLAECGGVILEVNTTPGFYYHYHRRGEACPVAWHVLHCLSKTPATPPAEVLSC
jgi:cyanophycin synthetase